MGFESNLNDSKVTKHQEAKPNARHFGTEGDFALPPFRCINTDLSASPQRVHIVFADGIEIDSIGGNLDRITYLGGKTFQVLERKSANSYDASMTKFKDADGTVWTRQVEQKSASDKKFDSQYLEVKPEIWQSNTGKTFKGSVRIVGISGPEFQDLNGGIISYLKNGAKQFDQSLICDTQLIDKAIAHFSELDKDGDGRINPAELDKAKSSKNFSGDLAESVAAVSSVYDKLITDNWFGQNGITLTDLVTLRSQLQLYSNTKDDAKTLRDMAANCSQFDLDKNGIITEDELKKAVQKQADPTQIGFFGANELFRHYPEMTKSTMMHGWDIKTGVTAKDILDYADKLNKENKDGTKQTTSRRKSAYQLQIDKDFQFKNPDAKTEKMSQAMMRSVNIVRSNMNALQDNQYSLNDMERLAREKAVSISKKFDIQFNMDPVKNIPARAPYYFELTALEQALKKSVPQQTRSHEQLAFSFIDEIAQANAYAYHDSCSNKSPTIVIQPEATGLGYSTTQNDPHDSLLGIYLHELGHNAAYNLKLLYPQANRFSDAKLDHDLGWIYKTVSSGQTIAALQATNGLFFNSGNDAFTFQRLSPTADLSTYRQANTDNNMFIRPAHHASKISADSLKDHLFVKPISNYYKTAQEMLAEGIMYYRFSDQSRADLKAKSPVLYAVVERTVKADEARVIKH